MITKEITYTNFDGEQITETLHFNLNKFEVIEIGMQYPNGIEKALKDMVETNDFKSLFDFIKKFIVTSYGIVGYDEGKKKFYKSESITSNFERSEAFSEFFVGLLQNQEEAIAFINNIIPK